MKADSIQGVIDCLDGIIADCKSNASRMGYFACLYRKMTLAIYKGIKEGYFNDAERMERLDVIFANRYLYAYSTFKKGETISNCWQTAFDATANNKLTVFQHLLLGINAHINLDLGIAAAHTCSRDTIDALQEDFNKINYIIASLFGEVQDNLSSIAFPMMFIKEINPRTTGSVLNFSITKARQVAWANALLLCEAGEHNEEGIIINTDKVVCSVAQRIQNPGLWGGVLMKWIQWTESKNIARNIDVLNNAETKKEMPLN